MQAPEGVVGQAGLKEKDLTTPSALQGFEYSSAAEQCVPTTCFTPEGQSVKVVQEGFSDGTPRETLTSVGISSGH